MVIRDVIPPHQEVPKIVVRERASEKTSKRVRELSFVLGFACIILFVINAIHISTSGLRLKKNVVEAAKIGFENIVSGAYELSDSNFENAEKLFAAAAETFQNIQAKAWFPKSKIPSLALNDPTFDTASSFLAAGKLLAESGQIFSKVAFELKSIPQQFFSGNVSRSALARPSLTESLKKQIPDIERASSALTDANAEIEKIPVSFIPREVRDRFAFAKNALGSLTEILKNLKEDIPAILTLLGDQEVHTFLILLQNNAELRPSGGFIGNFAIIETNDGYITKTEVHDIYSADHKLIEALTPPAEILPVNKRWFMRDSNYSGHFPLSAEKAAWFLEKENGPGVDTVIAIDQSVVTELLRLTGPVSIPELTAPLTAENFGTVTSYVVEAKISGREDPKAILKSFLPAFEQKLFERVDPVILLPLLKAQIESKHLLAYSKNPEVQDFFERHAAAGKMKTLGPAEDYLSVIHTSIGGNKSDQYVSEKIRHDTFIKSDGRVVDEVTISRSHEWNESVEQRLRAQINEFGFSNITKATWEILGRSRNLHMLRIYVPAGAVLIESSDLKTETRFDEETGKTYFSARMNVPVGKENSLKIRYSLPFQLNLDPIDKYGIAIQKQPGQDNVVLEKRIFPDSRVMNYKYFPENGSFDADGIWNFEGELNGDMNFVSVWGK